MKKTLLIILVLSLALVVVAACGGDADSGGGSGDADPAAGQKLFAQTVIGSQPGCSTCHSLDGSSIVGPYHARRWQSFECN